MKRQIACQLEVAAVACRHAVAQIDRSRRVAAGVDPPEELRVVERVAGVQRVDAELEMRGRTGLRIDRAVAHGGLDPFLEADRTEADGADVRPHLDEDHRSVGDQPEVGERRLSTGRGLPPAGHLPLGRRARLHAFLSRRPRDDRRMQWQQRAPPALDPCDHRVDGPRGLVPAENGVEVVALVLDNGHPRPQDPFAALGQRVDMPGVSRRSRFVPRVDEAVALELCERPVHARPVDIAEAQRPQVLHQAVAVALLLGQQQQDGRKQEPAGRCELEPRTAAGVSRRFAGMIHRFPDSPHSRHELRTSRGSTGARIVGFSAAAPRRGSRGRAAPLG